MVLVALAPRPLGNVRAVVDDDVLVARLRAGDDDALAELFDRYSGFVLGVARRVTRSTALAEEIAQDVFTAMWTSPERFDASRGSLRVYLGMLAYRRAVDVIRSDARRRAREAQCSDVGADAPIASDPLEAASIASTVRQAIASLPDEQRAAVELAFFHHHTYREVATILAIPEGTAKSRLRLAQSRLANLLGPAREELV